MVFVAGSLLWGDVSNSPIQEKPLARSQVGGREAFLKGTGHQGHSEVWEFCHHAAVRLPRTNLATQSSACQQ